jgi:PKD repeat protein
MAVSDVFKVYLYADPFVALYDVDLDEAEEITSGIMNVDIVEGTDTYEGPQEQIDTGQFTIVSRNPNLDPKINPNLKYNSAIKFYDERFGEFFRGYVTDINVEYQRNDNPIITITGTDIFGAMQRVVVSQDTHDAIMALSTGPTWNGITFTEFLPYMYDFTSKYLDLTAISVGFDPQCNGFFFPATGSFGQQAVENLNYSPAKYIPQVGETYLDVTNKYAQTNLTSFSARGPIDFFYINVYPFAKYDPNYWFPQQDPYLEYTDYDFNSDPDSNKPYETILIDNGYNRVINQVDMSNEYRFVDTGELKSQSENFTRTSSDSIDDYAISRASISTIYPEDGDLPNADWADRYSENIFQITGFPGQEIQKITFDNARIEDIESEYPYSRYELNRIIRIKHKIDDNVTIDRIHNLAGITHNISLNKWEMGFTLKPSKEDNIFINQGSLPILTMNETSEDSNFNFTATIGSVDPDRVDSIVWALSATDPDEPTLIYPYALNGNMFKNGLARTGYTQTWNFYDDGILAPYSFDSESTYTSPTDNRFGGYGPGYWNVYAFITLTNGFTILLQQQLVVGTPVVEADFGWVQDVTSNFGAVQFTDTSVNHETGEVDSYAWDFGDGTTSSERNPIKVYSPPLGDAQFDVSLTVYAFGPYGTKVYNTHTETVTLAEPVMTANFTFTQNRQVVTFTNTSTNVGFEVPDAYTWDFDDGTTSNEKNPVHTFPADDNETLSFDVTLTIKNIFGNTTSVTKSVEVVSLNASGTLGIRYIQLRQGNLYGLLPTERSGTGIAANICKFKGRSSFTQANLTYMKPMGNINTTNAIFRSYNNNIFDPGIYNNITSAYAGGLEPDAITVSSASNWSIIIDLETPTNYIKDIIAEFADNLTGSSVSTIGAYDIYTTKEIGTLSDPNAVTWFKIGSFEPGFVTRGSSGNRLPIQGTMDATRPMPMNIPYFDYTFNNLTATFTSYETADSYAWSFGDGTTSTLKDPVKTFPARGTYNVTLAVTNGGVVTRTTTEPVIVKALVNFDVRHVKFVQNLHTGTTEWDTPTILLANAKIGPISIPVGLNKYALTDFQYEDYSLEFYPSIGNSDIYAFGSINITSPTPIQSGGPYPNRMLSEPQTLFNQEAGIRAKSLDASYRTQWTAIVDLQKAHKGIEDFTINARRDYFGGIGPLNAPPANPGVTYSVYVTNDTSATINPNTVTWTKIGDITPTNLPTPKNALYPIGVEFPVVLT